VSKTYTVQLVGGRLDGHTIPSHERWGDHLHIQKLKSPYCIAYKLKDEAHHVYKRISATRAQYVGYTLEGERNVREFFRKLIQTDSSNG
jgi:hypothetical protein